MTLQYLGHSCFHLEFAGAKLLIDPFISHNSKASHINIDELEVDYILISHGHSDHVADAEKIAKRTKAPIISNFEIVSWFQDKGLEGHPMNIGGNKMFDFGTVKYVQATHSSTLPDGSCGGDPGGFVIWNSDRCVYFAGDTSVNMDMQLIPKLCPSLDLAILPIGDNFTMGYKDAIVASDFIQCDTIVGCHYDTFDLIEIDHTAAIELFNSHDKDLILLEIGEIREF